MGLEKLDNVTISSQERAEALRYGEGVGEVDPDDGDTLSNCADNRRMSIEELEDLRSEQGDNHLLAQPDLEEDYQRRYSSASGPDNQNSNILSSILCLIKEVDIPSLEVV